MIEKYSYKFDKTNPPVAHANSGETLVFKTLDCFSNLICKEEDKIGNFDFNKANPGTGPVYINEAKAGDVVKVEILKIDVNNKGVVATMRGIGPLIDRAEERIRVLEIDANKKIKLGDIEMTINPMVGVMGLAPAEGSIPCGYAGDHGGNMDCKLVTEGATLYFPVNVDGGLLMLGDLHALMGDCELCGTGLEIAGEVTVKVELIKNKKLALPILETKDKWYVVSSAIEYADALKKASEQMQDLICEKYGLDQTDAYLYLSLEGDVEINQACQPCPIEIVLRLGVPKRAGRELM